MKKYLVLDLGGTFVKYCIADENGIFLEQGKVPTVRTDMESFLKESLYPLLDRYKGKVEGCAVSMPGRIDTKRGYSHTAGAFNSFLTGVPFAAIIEERLEAPATIGNDGKCAAAAEAWSGSLKDVENGIVIVFGTGIGGGIIINHRVYMGSHFAAGELSDIVFDGAAFSRSKEYSYDSTRKNGADSPLWWSNCSASSLIRYYAERSGMPEDEVNGELFFAKVREEDRIASEIFDRFCYDAATNMISLQQALDVDRIAIGGGISAAPELLPALQKAFDELYEIYGRVLPSPKPELVRCAYGNDANLIGALKLHLDRQ